MISILYRFTLADGPVKEFRIELAENTLTLTSPPRKEYPDWTRLSFHQCPNCPLTEEASPRCPIAVNLMDVIDCFKDSISHEPAQVEISTRERTYRKQTALANGISSLVGIVMVTSGCPVMDKLKPMVKTHLPFASGEETVYRVLSMYLLAQFFLYKNGKTPDWDMKDLVKMYEGVRRVNTHFCKRLSATRIQDASLNAIIHLDCFADRTTFTLEEKQLEELERLFEAYLNEP